WSTSTHTIPTPRRAPPARSGEALDEGIGELFGTEGAAEISRLLTFLEGAVVRRLDALGDRTARGIIELLGEVIEHHDRRHDQRQGIGDVLARDVRRRAVYGFEDRAAFAVVCARNHTEPADQAGAQIADHIAV